MKRIISTEGRKFLDSIYRYALLNECEKRIILLESDAQEKVRKFIKEDATYDEVMNYIFNPRKRDMESPYLLELVALYRVLEELELMGADTIKLLSESDILDEGIRNVLRKGAQFLTKPRGVKPGTKLYGADIQNKVGQKVADKISDKATEVGGAIADKARGAAVGGAIAAKGKAGELVNKASELGGKAVDTGLKYATNLGKKGIETAGNLGASAVQKATHAGTELLGSAAKAGWKVGAAGAKELGKQALKGAGYIGQQIAPGLKSAAKTAGKVLGGGIAAAGVAGTGYMAWLMSKAANTPIEKVVNFISSKPAIAAAIPVAAAGAWIYKRYLSKGAKECAAYRGTPQFDACVSRFKVNSQAMTIAALQKAMKAVPPEAKIRYQNQISKHQKMLDRAQIKAAHKQ
jgi:hypothetical protein